jgi:hypothetical protein
MGTSQYSVRLESGERAELEHIVHFGKSSARRIARARILLKSDESLGGPWLSDSQVAEWADVSKPTVFRTRKRFVERGLEAAIDDPPASPRPGKCKIDGKAEAKLIATACGTPPEGRARWTLRLLADRLVQLHCVEDSVSYETVRRTLKKMNLSPGSRSSGVLRRKTKRNSFTGWKMS